MASIAGHHAEWLSLLDVSGPFLSVPVLKDALPNGLDAHDSSIAAELRAAMDQLDDPELADPGSVEAVDLHMAFVRLVMHGVLGFDADVLVWDPAVTSGYAAEIRPGVELAPDAVVLDGGELQLLVSVVGPLDRVDKPVPNDAWATSPQERMVEQLKSLGCRLGLVTDGERWTLVSVSGSDSPGFATWWASLWREEKITLQAFRTLLGQHRFVSVAENETLVALLDLSAKDQSEVTTKLGNQTLDAVEILIRTIDQIDRDTGGKLLADVEEAELYDAAVTVMMRLIFLFFAEENDLLPTSEPLYIERYAASTLRNRLQEAADQFGEEVLESTSDGWPRLLATWRAVFAGVDHSDMVLAPYGGSLFDPDRYPFLEGRLPGSGWIDIAAEPLPIDNRTVLHLLNALQTLDEGGQRRKLSFRALDIEQIGHVYEGMLDHTAARAMGWVLGLSGTGGKAPEIELDDLEAHGDEKALAGYLKDRTGRDRTSLKKWMTGAESGKAIDKFAMTWPTAFGGESEAMARAERFARLIRPDSTGAPTVFQPGSVYVADSSHRGATGTHYTPRSLTEEIVKHALDPLVHIGPADGRPETDWTILPAAEILDLKICDPACGSGAFLVQACRYLSEKIVEARRVHGEVDTDPTEEDLIAARREVVVRCLHGVDINPMACEMAKLSLWLVTLARDKPFTFIDHAIRCGDSLVGVSRLDQLASLTLVGGVSHVGSRRLRQLVGPKVERDLDFSLRRHDEMMSVLRSASDWRSKERALAERDEVLGGLLAVADAITDTALGSGGALLSMAEVLGEVVAPTIEGRRGYLHWPLEFPHVVSGGRVSFSAIIGNPPFVSGVELFDTVGSERAGLIRAQAINAKGFVDISAYFHQRAGDLVSNNGFVMLLGPQSLTRSANQRASIGANMSSGMSVFWARNRVPWPGEAKVDVCVVGYARSGYDRPVLDGVSVERIAADLTSGPDLASCRTLPKWVHYSQGTDLYGASFVRDYSEWAPLIHREPALEEFLRPYVNAKTLCSSPSCRNEDLVADFGESERGELTAVSLALSEIEEAVASERANQVRQIHEHRNWLHWDKRLRTYDVARRNEFMLVIPNLSKHLPVLRIPSGWLVSKGVKFFATQSWGTFALLHSSAFSAWTFATSPMRGNGVAFSTRSSLDTFAIPNLVGLDGPGEAYGEYRSTIQADRNLGCTDVLNLMNTPSIDDRDIAELRNRYLDMSNTVINAYGWEDLAGKHDFIESGNGVRLDIVSKYKSLLLQRLLDLNHERTQSTGEQGTLL